MIKWWRKRRATKLKDRVAQGELLSDREDMELFSYDCGREHPYSVSTMAGPWVCHCMLCDEARKPTQKGLSGVPLGTRHGTEIYTRYVDP